MIYTTCFMCYASFSWSRSRMFRIFLGIGLVVLATFITLYYAYLGDPVFHQNAYALLTATVLLRAMYNMETRLRPALVAEDRSTKEVSDQLDKRPGDSYADPLGRPQEPILREMWTMVVVGLAIFLSGFAIWALDNKFCRDLRRMRRELGLPWGIFLEGHGWW